MTARLALAAALVLAACSTDVVLGQRGGCGILVTDRCDAGAVDQGRDAELAPCGGLGESCCSGVNGGVCNAGLRCAARACTCDGDAGGCGD